MGKRMVGVAVATGLAVGVWLGPVVAGAQIASVVRPPAGARAAAARPTPYDTSTAQSRHPTTQLTELTAWVDSAVAAAESTSDVAAPTPKAGSPTRVPADPVRSEADGEAALADGRAVRFRNGAPAPDTASLLPTIALVGLITLGAGLAALAKGRRS